MSTRSLAETECSGVQYTFPTGGEYHLFADVAPKGAGSQVLMLKLKVSGKPGERYRLSKNTNSEAACRPDDLDSRS